MESTLQIFDVQEREVGAPKPPSFPTPPTPGSSASSATGFPVHKKRVSAFKKQRQSQPAVVNAPQDPSADIPTGSTPADGLKKPANEKETINRENKEVIDNMSPAEIAQAQEELFNALDPSLIQMLLRRANLDENNESSIFDTPPSAEANNMNLDTPASPDPTPETKPPQESESAPVPAPLPDQTQKSILKDDPATGTQTEEKKPPKKSVRFDEDADPGISLATSDDAAAAAATLPSNTTHFPHAPDIPDLDPSDPDFLENLHKKYFPNLPADPSKLAWMAPLPTPNSTADRESPYYPNNSDFPVSALRFDFRGKLLTPRVSRKIPVTKGLHHHGEAPEAAGYAIPELARYARSAVPGQRCIAYQTLGRMLYRLGNGEWGNGEGGRVGEEDDLAFGLWRCFQEGRVLESLEEEASLPEGKGHMSSKAYAVEALWLFEKGGWKEKWRGL